jgi:hypothetical protein
VTNQQFAFPYNTGGSVTRSADSTKFMFTDIQRDKNRLAPVVGQVQA